MATLEKVQAQITKLQAQAEALAAKQSSGVVAKICDIMEKHGLTTADIEAHISGSKKRGPKPGPKGAVKSVAPVAKYQDPRTGATWTGHGRAPAWLASAKDRTKFLIDSSSAAVNVGAANKSKTAVKAAGKTTAKGKLPPKYINPKTGETWSGHARPPAWIAEAKDRSKFLIAGGAEATIATTTGTGSKVKTAAKKALKSVGATAGKGQRKGPQPALYRDPKTGATWSGRGPAPAWLAGAKDRSRFLIAGAAQGAAEPKAAAAKKAPAKKAPARKAATKKPVAKRVAARKGATTAEKAPKKAAVKKVAVKKAAAKKVAVRRVAPSTAAESTQVPVTASETAGASASA
ncbi:H-NS family nucleoid-associated regulatory protein [Paraburkholderia terrae]|uniref:Histidine biosynthesis protein HisIE n=1 Tax=Paraburkholderia terrae TaxID=311230 RepID=A0A2I8F3S8_9BURK|nr:H-NS family nucleoid-associated regulatory protein [Paraburkholderia terrae]AUT66505.1 histidine biosynthesis protein HisIE [Paraburkholderia terrae]